MYTKFFKNFFDLFSNFFRLFSNFYNMFQTFSIFFKLYDFFRDFSSFSRLFWGFYKPFYLGMFSDFFRLVTNTLKWELGYVSPPLKLGFRGGWILNKVRKWSTHPKLFGKGSETCKWSEVYINKHPVVRFWIYPFNF